VLDDFLLESREELFPSREACLEWATAHYQDLVDGTKGGNLLSKYSMLGRFYATMPSLDFLETGIAAAVSERGGTVDKDALEAVMSYLRAVVLHVPFAETLATPTRWTSQYDVEAWIRDRQARPLSAYTLDSPRTLTAGVGLDTRALIETNVATFGEHPSGLGKFTRTLFARDLRRRFATGAAP
jgi:hypothetical protein